MSASPSLAASANCSQSPAAAAESKEQQFHPIASPHSAIRSLRSGASFEELQPHFMQAFKGFDKEHFVYYSHVVSGAVTAMEGASGFDQLSKLENYVREIIKQLDESRDVELADAGIPIIDLD